MFYPGSSHLPNSCSWKPKQLRMNSKYKRATTKLPVPPQTFLKVLKSWVNGMRTCQKPSVSADFHEVNWMQVLSKHSKVFQISFSKDTESWQGLSHSAVFSPKAQPRCSGSYQRVWIAKNLISVVPLNYSFPLTPTHFLWYFLVAIFNPCL